jgi:DNA-binding transcriptional LysR family regulator
LFIGVTSILLYLLVTLYVRQREHISLQTPELFESFGGAASYPADGSGTRREFEKILLKEGIGPQQLSMVGLFGSTDAMKQAVRGGMGISIISRRAVRNELKCNMLREIRIKDVNMKRHFFIVTHRKRTLPHIYKGFLEYLLASAV